MSAARPLLCDLLRAGAAQAFSDKAKFALKKVDRFADTAVAAETIFGERSIDLVGEPQWIVAVLFGTGHSLVPDALIAAALARWIASYLRASCRFNVAPLRGTLRLQASRSFAGISFREDFAHRRHRTTLRHRLR